MAQGYFLTEADVAAVQALLEKSERFVERPGAPSAEDTITAPEMFVARTPDEQQNPPNGGIPGLIEEAGVGFKDEPGHADCDLYRVLKGADNRWTLRAYPEHSRRVYNLSLQAIPKSTWVLVIRDKAGAWWAVTGGAADPSAVVQVTSERVSTVYYRSYRGTNFNEPTRSFQSKVEILVLDASDIGFPP